MLNNPKSAAPAASPKSESRAEEGHIADPRSADADSDDVCWRCGGRTIQRHCKILCTNCGFMRDCSDP